MRLINKQATKTSLGCLSKGWYTDGKSNYLVKGNSNSEISSKYGFEPFSEVLAYRLGKLLKLPVIEYVLAPQGLFPDINTYNCDYVSVCKQIELGDGQLIGYCSWADLTNGKEVKDCFSFYLRSELSNLDLAKMLIFDAVIGNCDRHLNNFDVMLDNTGATLAPIFDNGASMLAYKSEAELKLYHGIGFDVSKPFKHTHTEQISLVKRRLNPGIIFEVQLDKIYAQWVKECDDVFNCMPGFRVQCIKNYVKHRLSFLEDFNFNQDGGDTDALNVFQ